MGSLLATAYHSIRGFVLVAPWIIYLFIIDIILSALLPAAWLFPTAVYNISSALAFSVWNWVQILFELVNGADITISGDDLPHGESAIVIANHVSWTDFYMIQALAVRCGMLSRCRWFAKIQLRNVPFLGWGIWAMGMPMVSRKWTQDKKELDRVFRGITDRRWPTWLISYSEATRYTPEKHEEAITWCKANGKPVPKHLLYPRLKGFQTTVAHLRKAPHMKAVYDLTIAYSYKNRFLEAPNMWDTLSMGGLSNKGYKFEVHARRFQIKDLPQSDEDLGKWLETRWIEKGEWLEQKRMAWARSET